MINIEACRNALYRFCQGKERMRVPAQDDDDDMILSAALDRLEYLQTLVPIMKNALDETIPLCASELPCSDCKNVDCATKKALLACETMSNQEQNEEKER